MWEAGIYGTLCTFCSNCLKKRSIKSKNTPPLSFPPGYLQIRYEGFSPKDRSAQIFGD